MRLEIVFRYPRFFAPTDVLQKLRDRGPIDRTRMIIIDRVTPSRCEPAAVAIKIIQAHARSLVAEAPLQALSQPALAGAAAAYNRNYDWLFTPLHTVAF